MSLLGMTGLKKICMRCRRKDAVKTRKDSRGYTQYVCEGCYKRATDVMNLNKRKGVKHEQGCGCGAK